MRSDIGDKEVSESKLQVAPPWITKNANAKEVAKYKDSVKDVSRSSLPRSAYVASSHHFFNMKFDVGTRKLMLKCRTVPHGNKDDLKDEIRSDSSIAQLPVI